MCAEANLQAGGLSEFEDLSLWREANSPGMTARDGQASDAHGAGYQCNRRAPVADALLRSPVTPHQFFYTTNDPRPQGGGSRSQKSVSAGAGISELTLTKAPVTANSARSVLHGASRVR